MKGAGGCTALMLAASRGLQDIAGVLLEAGADPQVEDADGHSALWHAETMSGMNVFEDTSLDLDMTTNLPAVCACAAMLRAVAGGRQANAAGISARPVRKFRRPSHAAGAPVSSF